MTKTKFIKPLVLCSVVSCALLGCANSQIANPGGLDQQAKELASSAQMTPEAAVAQAAGDIKDAEAENLEFFAPLHYRDALNALEQAQSFLNSPETNAQVLQEAFKVRSLLQAAKENKAKVQTSLAQALEQDQVLRSLDAHRLSPGDYEDVIDDLRELIKEIEGGDLNTAIKGQAALLEDMIDLEIDTLKLAHLSEAESMLDKAESIDADDYAEKTYEKAESTLEFAHRYVEKNYRNRGEVAQKGLEAFNTAAHAYFVAKEAKELVTLDEEAAEQKVLYFESMLERVNKPLNLQYLNTVSLYDQSVKLSKAIETLQDDLERSKAVASERATPEPVSAESTSPQNAADESAIAEQTDVQPEAVSDLINVTPDDDAANN